jgi:hypothetical protein
MESEANLNSGLAGWLARPWFLTLWCVAAAFGAYACMYGFRKPFTAAGFGGPEMKALLVAAQVFGYTLSKFIGIKVIAEMPAARRAAALAVLVAGAEAALLLFAVTPAPWNSIWLFCNGLPLGLVFGLVLGFVEGRRMTEVFVAGLCASFIVADGVAKSVGALLLQAGVSEAWMPAAAGALFAPPLLLFTWMLTRIPEPDTGDVKARSARAPMTRSERRSMLRRHGLGLFGVVLAYLLVTVVRSVRADFAPEIWTALGFTAQPGVFAASELWVAFGVVIANGSLVLLRDNRRAFFAALALCAAGLALALAVLLGGTGGWLPPFPFMVLLGLGMYAPYVAVHTTVFERLISLTRERGNIGYLMYLADAAGYLGYVIVMLCRGYFPAGDDFLKFFVSLSLWLLGAALVFILISWARYASRVPSPNHEAAP